MPIDKPQPFMLPPAPSRWETLRHADWIWSDADRSAGGQVALFRLTFQSKPGTVTWTGFADTFYTIYCNGRPMGIGPSIGIHTLPRLSTWDLTPLIVAGTNSLAIEVWFEGRDPRPPDVDPLRAGLIGWLQTSDGVIPTGPRWRTRRSGRYTFATPAKRGFGARRIVAADLRGEPDGWTRIGFDDSGWPMASVSPHPEAERPVFRDSTIPTLTCTTRPAAIIDAGIARGGREVKATEDVAHRMAEQTHESLLRTTHTMSVLSEERTAPAIGLPEAARFVALGWPDLTSSPPSAPFRIPLKLALPTDGEFYIVMDMSLQTSGSVWLDVESASDLTIDLGYADRLHLGRVNPALQNHAFADRIIVSAGRHRTHVPTDRGFRYLQCTFSDPATLHAVWLDEHVYPHDDTVRFHSSDATLNAIWEMARATAHQCSLWSHVDNARRERQGWGGPDLYGQSHGFFHLFGDLRLTKKMLEDFCDYADAQGFIPNWCPGVFMAIKWISGHDLWFPQSAWDYLLHSDDRELAPRLLAASEAVLEFYGRNRVGGLIGRAHPDACRWTEWNMNAAQECSTWENLLAVESLRALAKMRRYIGIGNASQAHADAAELASMINQRLWHPRHGALAQGTRDGGALVDFCAQVDNAYALRFDILEPDRREQAYRFCAGASGTWPTSRSGWQGSGQGERARYDARKPVVTGTPLSGSLCAQVIHGHSPAEAVQYIRYNFGAMLDEGEGTLWEMWPVHQNEHISSTCISQGYGIHIAATLVGHIAGLKFIDPGGVRLRWRPMDCGVKRIEARVETKFGAVTVRRDGMSLAYSVPTGVTLEIETGTKSATIVGPAEVS